MPGYPEPTVEQPSEDELIEQLEAHVMDTQTHFGTSDGCEVEADGTCHHGHPTWLRRAGWI